jgi:hypothetical protein
MMQVQVCDHLAHIYSVNDPKRSTFTLLIGDSLDPIYEHMTPLKLLEFSPHSKHIKWGRYWEICSSEAHVPLDCGECIGRKYLEDSIATYFVDYSTQIVFILQNDFLGGSRE